MKVLLVEDEKVLADGIASYLGKEAFIVETAYTYSDAIERINLYSYDGVIVDINLPDGLGFDIVETLKNIKNVIKSRLSQNNAFH